MHIVCVSENSFDLINFEKLGILEKNLFRESKPSLSFFKYKGKLYSLFYKSPVRNILSQKGIPILIELFQKIKAKLRVELLNVSRSFGSNETNRVNISKIKRSVNAFLIDLQLFFSSSVKSHLSFG